MIPVLAKLFKRRASRPAKPQYTFLSDRDLADMGIKRYQIEGL